MRDATWGAAALCLALLGCSLSTGPILSPPQPSSMPGCAAELRAALDRVAGDWVFEGESIAPDGTAQRETFPETCAWIPNGYHLVCRSPGDTAMTLMGYDATDCVVTHYRLPFAGAARPPVAERGRLEDGAFVFERAVQRPEGPATRRVTMRWPSADEIAFLVEVRPDGGEYRAALRGSYRRAAASP